LPAITSTSPGRAEAIASVIASRRSASDRTLDTSPPPRCGSTRAAPAMISAMMLSGSSERGLSEVTSTTSASRAAISPISGRLPRSRSPPAPNTQITRPPSSSLAPASSRAAPSTFSRESGVWA
jgi:hypothetical protein